MIYKAGDVVSVIGTECGLKGCEGMITKNKVYYAGKEPYQTIQIVKSSGKVPRGTTWDVFCEDMMPVDGLYESNPNLAFKLRRK